MGRLSTPRTGVGACGGGNGGTVSALTVAGGATVDGGLVELPQSVPYPTPPLPNPMPATGNMNFNGGCPGGLVGCTNLGGGALRTRSGIVIDSRDNGPSRHEGRCRDQCPPQTGHLHRQQPQLQRQRNVDP